jgi:hypothetical protein
VREGRWPHPDDLVAILNQRKATTPGGFYGIIIGDVRRHRQYSSYQAEAIVLVSSVHARKTLDFHRQRNNIKVVNSCYNLWI